MWRLTIMVLVLCCMVGTLSAAEKKKAEEGKRIGVGVRCVVMTGFTKKDVTSLIAVNKLRKLEDWPVYERTALPYVTLAIKLPKGMGVRAGDLDTMQVTDKEVGTRTAYFFYDSKRKILVIVIL